ncbi:type IV secretion system protein [Neisseriaceae bacterium B1]
MNPDEIQNNLTGLIEGVTDITLYTSMRDYIYALIDYFTEHVLSQNLTLALTISGSLLTLWILFQGFLIVTRRSQENLKSVLFGLGKNYIIILMALGFASNSQFAVRTLTNTLTDGISQIMTGSDKSGSQCLTQASKNITGCKIDRNLTITQGIMGYMSKIDTADSAEIQDKVEKAKWFAGVGSAGPGVVAGVMLIMYRIAMSLFIGFGPLFILCLLFKKTSPLFSKWLYYGLATIFSSVMLAVMADIAMDLTSTVAGTLFTSNKLLSLLWHNNLCSLWLACVLPV